MRSTRTPTGSPPPILPAVLLAFGTSLSVLAGGATISLAQAIRGDLDKPYGPVLAQARSGNTLYIGGEFTHVGPLTGSPVTLSSTTGHVVGDLKIRGSTGAIIPDGAGGWFIAGNFGSFGGQAYEPHIAHFRADGSLAPLNTYTNGSIYTLALLGTTLYMGGNFTNVDGYTRIMAVAVDVVADTVTAWDAKLGPTTSNWVASLAVANGLVYIGGFFDGVAGDPTRVNAAAVDATTGALAPWNPVPNDVVDALATDGSVVYMAGAFWTVSGQSRSALAAVDATLGQPTAWNPGASSRCTALMLRGSTVYVGGGFYMVGGLERRAFAAIDATTGEVRPWPSTIERDPIEAGPSVAALAMIGSTLYIGGDFTSVGGELRQNIAAIDTVTGRLTSWDPGATGRVWTLAAADSVVFAGGSFDRIGGEVRHRLAAIDLAGGRTTAWNPDANDVVRALAVNGSTVYTGGSFGRIGGQPHKAIAALDADSGTPSAAWTSDADGSVRALAVSASLLYVGGTFTHVGGQPRSRIGALDATTGLATAWQPNADSTVRMLVTGGSVVYAGGDFSHVGGADHMRVAALDSATGNAAPWDLHAMGQGQNVYGLALHGPTLYVGGNFTEIGGQPRRNLAALDAATGNATAWNHDFYKSTYAIVVGDARGGTVYVGGGEDSEQGLLALDGVTGAAASWHPRIYSSVYSLVTDGTYVYAGGQGGLFAVEALDVTGTLLSLFQAEAAPDGVVLRWQFGGAAQDAELRIERSEPSNGPWTPLDVAIRSEGGRFSATDRGVEADRTYRYRLIVELASGSVTFGPIEVSTGPVAKGFALTRVSPSPATGPVTIEFTVARQAPIRLTVLDIQGRVTARLVDGTVRPGSYQAVWSGDGSHGPARAGVYFVRYEAAGPGMTKRLVLDR